MGSQAGSTRRAVEPDPAAAELPRAVDLVVIGAGIIGLSVAWEAARRQWEVLVIDRDEPGSGASTVAAGMLAPISEARPTEEPLVRFGRESLERYPDFIEVLEGATGIDCHLQPGGVLLVAVDRDHLEVLDHEQRNLASLGLAAERLTGRRVLEMEPRLNPEIVGGLATREDRSVDPRRVTRALVRALEDRGNRVAARTTLDVLHRDGGVRGVELMRDGRRHGVETPRLLVAAGSWSHEVLPELSDLPLRPVKGQLLRLHGEVLIDRMVRTPDVYLVPRDNGELVVGASSEEQGFDETATAGLVMDLLYEAWRALPGIYELALREINVGFRPALRDNLPAIGPAGVGIPGLYLATGHYRNGILLAPATAHHLVATMETGEVSSELSPFTPDRFRSS